MGWKGVGVVEEERAEVEGEGGWFGYCDWAAEGWGLVGRRFGGGVVEGTYRRSGFEAVDGVGAEVVEVTGCGMSIAVSAAIDGVC